MTKQTMKYIIRCFLCLSTFVLQAQETTTLWHNPESQSFRVVEGQAWPTETKDFYDRLPARAEGQVREPVYGLSKHGAGLMIRFRSSASKILVRYGLSSKEQFGYNHMPATGVSGVDLYAIDSDGEELWCAARRTFADTVVYSYNGLTTQSKYHNLGPEYRLYLPLYNHVDWLEIGVADDAHFEFLPVRKEKPIVIYGTSITQGACASRPGMAWASIVGRKMDRPLINLGFSGNGRLEKEVVDIIKEIKAKIFVIDCLPNLVGGNVTDEELTRRILETVHLFKAAHPDVPILLVDHAGYTDGLTNDSRKQAYSNGNKVQQAAYETLLKEGVGQLYYLTNEEIGLELDDMVDGTHPTDLGMVHYAEAYEAKLRTILKEPMGKASTTHPITQYREPSNYDWEKRHREILELNQTNPPKSIIIANSIVHFWGGSPKARIVRESTTWDDYLSPNGFYNYAYGWDRIENVLWRVYHGELDGFDAEQILVMIGTNNLHLNSNDEIIEGLTLLTAAIKERQPTAELVLMGILPRRDYEERITALNFQIAQLAGASDVRFADLGSYFLLEDKEVDESLFSDGLHPNEAGYLRLREGLMEVIDTSSKKN